MWHGEAHVALSFVGDRPGLLPLSRQIVGLTVSLTLRSPGIEPGSVPSFKEDFLFGRVLFYH